MINQHHGPLLVDVEMPPLGPPGVLLDTSDDESDGSGDESDDSLIMDFIAFDDNNVLNALIAQQNQPQPPEPEEDQELLDLEGVSDDEFEMMFYRKTLESLTRIIIRNAIMEKSENVHLFLEEKISEVLQEYNKQQSGFLMQQMAGKGQPGDSLMEAISRKRDWISIEETHGEHLEFWEALTWRRGCIYKIRCDLQDFGVFSVEVETRDFDLGSPESLSQKACYKISSRLIYEYLHSTHCTLPQNICLKWCNIDNVPNWAALAEWKAEKLQIPETLRSQVLATMHWLFWSKAFF